MRNHILLMSLSLFICMGCEKQINETEKQELSLEELACLFSDLNLSTEHLLEVHSAVSSSIVNGYDEEYTIRDIFLSPGKGVGATSSDTKAAGSQWENPLRDLLTDAIVSKYSQPTKSDNQASFPRAEDYLTMLKSSDAQIYWPYSELWDGIEKPLITFDPGDGSLSSIAFEMLDNGSVREVTVTEKTAMERPVWVINRNNDSSFMTLDVYRREHPQWGQGGSVTILPSKSTATNTEFHSLIMKEMVMKRNYDSWLAGASEMFIKCASVEDFNASTEAELLLYNPTITDFMVVIRRSQVGVPIPFNVMLISEWTEQLEDIAFMITEDDGGTRTTWKCSATVKVNSKSYGFDVSIPYNTRDDIVWRGKLSRRYFEKYKGETGHFGDVDITFDIV